jgi:hypothetical protein
MKLPSMTLMDYFAAQAMSGLLAAKVYEDWEQEQLIRKSYDVAAQMLDIKEEIEENLN